MMIKTSDYRDLKVWQKAIDLTSEILSWSRYCQMKSGMLCLTRYVEQLFQYLQILLKDVAEEPTKSLSGFY